MIQESITKWIVHSESCVYFQMCVYLHVMFICRGKIVLEKIINENLILIIYKYYSSSWLNNLYIWFMQNTSEIVISQSY